MNTARLQRIRQEEKQYHEACFEQHRLYAKGSWLDKPIPLVMQLIEKLDNERPLAFLDLGCGVGRNSIPLAQRLKPSIGRIHCVDLLDLALEKLQVYSHEFNVDPLISTEQADISSYEIPPDTYDYIVAASSLEHVKSEESFNKVLRRMAEGTKPGGINFIMMNTNIEEFDQRTGQKRETYIEVVMSQERALASLQAKYTGWERLHLSTTPMRLEITRQDVPILLQADSLMYAVKRPKEAT
ncbi:class I SAM-dependent methyltransferase [Paenibacillus alba]|uniref:Class I SAM-dependent methyltransferase n=1 Tax=Paenibacillus alba TaxID=1197127 RepID=A0ABU6G320_9BACL|nr:class I SAM-dependent methyltransferase [Paenibacillus alba]MEC0228375.1 class I SAM-dependent methyltransferase [Paenibacillus alba]